MIPSWSGTMATIWSTRKMGQLSVRPTSRIAARAASVPNVPICATLASPYLSLTYCDDLAPTFLAEVDVDVGRFEPIFVQKSLEQQIVFEWTNVAHSQCIADERPDARPTRRARDVLLDRIADKVPDDQEIVVEAQLVDHAQFAIEPGEDFARIVLRRPSDLATSRGVAFLQSGNAEFAQVIGRGLFARAA